MPLSKSNNPDRIFIAQAFRQESESFYNVRVGNSIFTKHKHHDPLIRMVRVCKDNVAVVSFVCVQTTITSYSKRKAPSI